MLTQTITAPAVTAAKIVPAPHAQTVPTIDRFSVIASSAGAIASEAAIASGVDAVLSS